jgi:Abnormal spindle-like microcephaly-assoc'd, ASPM-SPD-2-Hydin/HYDIN/CFA65/VesB-like, Ig-like domain/Beta-propeller repeat
VLCHKLFQCVVITSVLSFSSFANAQSLSATRARETKLVIEPAEKEANGSYITRHDGLEAYFTQAAVTVSIPRDRKSRALMEIRLLGAAPEAGLRAEEKLPSYTNYLIGPDARKWRTLVDNYGRLRYQSIYPGIDLVYYGNGSTLEHDFIVSPGAQAGKIAFRIEHADNVKITRDGDLRIGLGGPLVVFKRPVAYQEIAGRREPVQAAFVYRSGTDTIGFALGAYDHSRQLIIDPVLSFATYLDGTQNDAITATTTDAAGNVYVTGTTSSSDFPLAGAPAAFCNAQCTASTKSHAFVSKLDPTGHTLLYSTFIGGSNGEVGGTIAIDGNGNIIVAGGSNSSDFPQAGSFSSQTPQINVTSYFVASLTPDGSALNYAGLLGSGLFVNGESGLVAVDSQGNAYVAGETESANFPITPGTLAPSVPGFPFDSMFISKIGPSGTLVYSTIVPGTVTADPAKPNVDQFVAWGIAVDSGGNAIIAGNAGPGLPTTGGVVGVDFPLDQSIEDVTAGFVLKLNASASAIVFASYVPGADNIHALAVDGSGGMFVTGQTNETNLAVSANAFQKTVQPGQNCTCSFGYVLELDSQAQSILNASYLTGTTAVSNIGTLYTAIALDSNSNIVVSGTTGSSDVPMKNPLVSQFATNFFITPTNGYIAELSADFTTLLFGSFFSGTDNSTFTGLSVDSNNNAVLAGTTFGSDLPTTTNAFQTVPPTPPAGPPFEEFPHTFAAKINLNATAPSVCFGSPAISFGAVLVGTSANQTLNMTNCGNASLQISNIASSLATVTASQSCGSVAPGGVCPVQVTFSPVTAMTQTGTLTFTDNASIASQAIGVSGTGGVPEVFFPTGFSVSELIVGTQQESFLTFENFGNGAWIVSNVSATGDFTVDNQCTAPVPPVTITIASCRIGIIFAPTQPGLRTGALTITDNQAGSPHVISLAGNALSTYPTPSIVSIGPIPTDRQNPELLISGTNFLPGSQVMVNGTSRSTVYESQFLVEASLLPGDMVIGELSVTVSNPAPGGGVSNTFSATIYGVLRGILILHSVFEPHSGLIYASVSTSSKTFAGQMIAIDPSIPKVVSNFSVGNGPNQLAIAGDGSLLYVGLDGDGTVAQVALPGGTVNFAVTLGTNPVVADALRVLPGLPHSWVVTICATSFSPCGLGVAVFDDSTERTTAVSESQLDADGLLFIGNDATTLYATSFTFIPSTFWKFSIDSSGITQTSATTNFSSESPGGAELDTDGTLIYTGGGQVIDPSTVTIKNHLQGIPVLGRIRVDVAGSRIYFTGHDPNFSDLQIASFDLVSLQRTGVLNLPEFGSNSDAEIYRWGSNGLALTDQIGAYILHTSLTGPVGPAQFSVSGLSPASVVVGSSDLALTINGTGFVDGDTVTANGVALTATVASGTQITTTVPAALLTSLGNLQISVSTPDSHVGNLVLIITPVQFSVSGLSPTSVMAGSPDLALTINGTGFVAGDTVTANGTALSANVASGTRITATVPAALLTSVGNLQITVTTPDNHMGNRVLVITPAFSLSGLSPVSVVAGSPDLALTINGTGFVAGDTVTAAGTTLSANVASGTQISATVPAALLTSAGNLQVTVTTPDNHMGNLVLVITPAPPPPPVAAVSASALNFPAQLVNTTSGAQIVTVANNGGSNLIFNSITASGDFSQSNNCSTVAPGSSCSISVTFKPTTGGSRSGALTINDNAATSPQGVNLGGVGSAIVINANSSSVTVNAGQTATYTLNLSAQGGLSGQVTFNCSNLPANASCSFNPPSAALSGSGVTITVSIATAQQTASLVHSAITVFAVVVFPMGLIGLGKVRRGKRGRAAALFCGTLLLGLLFLMAGCGGGGSPVGGPHTVLTPPGTYTVTFTANGGGTSQSLPLTLVVQ